MKKNIERMREKQTREEKVIGRGTEEKIEKKRKSQREKGRERGR